MPIGNIINRTQWNSPKTFKRTIKFEAFQPDGTNSQLLPLLSFNKRTVLISFKWHPSIVFDAPGITKADMQVQWGIGGVPFTNDDALIAEMSLLEVINTTTGFFRTTPQFRDGAGQNANNIIFNHNADTNIFLQVDLNNAVSFNDLTAGEFEVWFTTIRNV